jgi:MFS family permease
MEMVVRSVIVYELTDSALLLGLINATRSIPSLIFGAVGGVLADRMDRRVVLMVSQAVHSLSGLTLGMLVVLGIAEPWHFAVMAFVEGGIGAIQQPARQAMVPSVVERRHLLNAVTLNSGNNRIARMVAPAVAGIVAALAGPASALFLEAAFYIVAAIAISRVRFHPPVTLGEPGSPNRATGAESGGHNAERGGRRPAGSLADGLRGYGYLRENAIVMWLVVLGLAPTVFSLSNQTMAPVFARDVLDLGPGGVGLLLSAPGVGSVLAMAFLASAGDMRRKGLVSLAALLLMAATLILFGFSNWVWLSLVALAVHGFGQAAYQTTNHTLVQLHTPDEYRGRVLAVYNMDRSLHPLGVVVTAALAELWGPQLAIAFNGVACVAALALVVTRAPALRTLE